MRVQGEIASATAEANAQCTYRIIIKGENGLPVEIEARTDWMGLAASESQTHVPNFVASRLPVAVLYHLPPEIPPELVTSDAHQR